MSLSIHDDSASESLQERFRRAQPEVVASFGGNEGLFQSWWGDVTAIDPPDAEFVQNYSTNDRFLKNRLILPEEVPLFTLPLLKAIRVADYRKAFFIERGAYPYLWAARQLAPNAGIGHVAMNSVRVKGLTRESLARNLLTMTYANAEDRRSLSEPLSQAERSAVERHVCRRSHEQWVAELEERCNLTRMLGGTRAQIVEVVADVGLDERLLLPNVIKTVVFLAANQLREGPVTPEGIFRDVPDDVLKLAPTASKVIVRMLREVEASNSVITLPALLDWMHQFVRSLRGTIHHATRPILNVVLGNTRTASAMFGLRKTTFIDEVSVCGSACLAVEAISRAFRKDCQTEFCSVVGMWSGDCFLDAVAANFFEFKPLEDVPFLSPHYHVPISHTDSRQTINPQRFPSCQADTANVSYWKRRNFEDDAAECQRAPDEFLLEETRLVGRITSQLSWDRYPAIRMRSQHDPEVLRAVFCYYLGSFDVSTDQIRFTRDALLDARLETVLGFCGRFQKQFVKEMDCLFQCLCNWERREPTEFRLLRRSYETFRTAMRQSVVCGTCDAHARYQERMRAGIDAICRMGKLVAAYLEANMKSTIEESGCFRKLLTRLQEEIRL